MAREKWTVEIEVDVETFASSWSHMNGKDVFDVLNEDDGIISGMEDGIHLHRHMGCQMLLPWKVVKREEVTEGE